MNSFDFDRAFPKTPDCIHSAIEMGFRKGEKKMKMRNKIISMASAAAGLVIVIAVAALAAGGFSPTAAPDLLAQPLASDERLYTLAPETAMPTAAPMLVSDNEEAMVWYTEKGNYYHAEEQCSGMEGAKPGALSDALALGKGACPVCNPPAPAIADEAMYWCTEHGNYYHTDEHCSGMEGAIYGTLSYALALNKQPCPVCVTTPAPEKADSMPTPMPTLEPAEETASFAEKAMVYGSDGGVYYHAYADCSGMRYNAQVPLLEMWEQGKKPCPTCITPIYVFSPEDASYYHSDRHCSGMQDASAMYAEEAHALGKQPCPVCILQREVYYVVQGKYYHNEAQCITNSNSHSGSLLQSIATGMMPCPDCMDQDVTEDELNASLLENPEPEAAADGQILYMASYPDYENADTSIVYVAQGADSNNYHRLQNCGGRDFSLKLTESQVNPENFPPCSACYYGYVYYSKSSKYYHSDEYCQGMTDAKTHSRHDADTDNKLPCPICLNVYCTNGGTYFHAQKHCSGMQGANLIFHSEAIAAGKQPCPVCLETAAEFSAATPQDYDLFTTAFGQDIEDLYPGYSYDYSTEISWFISNGTESIYLCDVYPEGTAFFGEELPGVPELHLSNEGLSANPEQVHAFMQNAPAPIGSMYAAASAEVEKQIKFASADLSREELKLTEVAVCFDTNRQVNTCEMQFGYLDPVKFAWKVGADGQIELTESNIDQEQSWGHSAGKDLIEASAADDTEFWPSPYSNPNPTTPENIIVYGPKNEDTYHQNADCSPTFFSFNTIEMTLADAWLAGRVPCADCLGTGAAKDERANCFVSDDDDRFHSSQSCGGIASTSGLKATTVAQARSMHKRRCPDCCQTTPINYFLFKLAFGQEISALYPGWAYEYSHVLGMFDSIHWFYSNDEQIVQVCEVNTNNTDCYVHLNNLQSVDMESFMANAPDALRHIYFDLAPQEIAKYPAEPGGEERFLYSINVSLKNDRISGLVMTYGFFDSITFAWEIDESGGITLISTDTADF